MSKPKDEAFKVFKEDGVCNEILTNDDMITRKKCLLLKKDIERAKISCPICRSKKVYTVYANICPEYNYFCYNCDFVFIMVGQDKSEMARKYQKEVE